MSEHREIKVPPLGESVSEGTVARWLKNVGDAVTADEVLVELETDKVTMEVTAPTSGALYKIDHPVGSTVHVGQILGLITPGAVGHVPSDAKVLAAQVEERLEATIKEIIAKEHTHTPAVNLSASGPAVHRIVAENAVDTSNLVASGKDGRLTKGDVLGHTKAPTHHERSHAAPSSYIELPAAPANSSAREERVKISRLRQRIAERLKHAQNTAAILTTFNEIDMSAVFKLRNQYREAFEKKHGVRLGFMSFFVKAAIRALKETPAVNAEINGDEIIYKNYYDIGVAVSAPHGLVVPIVRDADSMSFAELEKSINELGVKARDGKLSIEDMTGGTFTISNGGVFGSLMSTPILNPPQTGILGMHKIQERPVAIDGKVEIRPMMYIALSYDHRLIDGREAVTFLVRIKENIENPERLLLEV